MNVFQVLAILWARRWIVVAVVIGALASAAAIVRVLPERYEATAQIMLNVADPDIVTNAILPAALIRDTILTHIEVLRSSGQASKAVEVLGWDKRPEMINAFKASTNGNGDIREWLGENLRSRIVVARVGSTDIVSIKATAGNAAEAAAIANAYVTAHKLKDIQMRIEPAQEVLRWYEDQIGTLQKSLATAQSERIETRRAADARNTGPRIIGDDSSALAREFAASRVELIQAQVLLEQAKAQQANASALPDVVEARRKLREMDQRIAQETATLGAGHRIVKQLQVARVAMARETESASQQALARATQSAQESVTVAERKLADIAKTADATLDQTDARTNLTSADRQIEAIQSQIKVMLDRRERLRLGGAIDRSPIAELSRALPANSPAFPKPGFTMALAGGLGFAFALVLALLAEMFDRRIHNSDDVRSFIKAPVLAAIPRARLSSRRKAIAAKAHLAGMPAKRAITSGGRA